MRQWVMKRTIITAGVLATLLTSAATSVASPAGAKGITKKAAGKQYQALANAANAATNKFGAEASKWNNSTTNAQFVADAKPLIAKFNKFDAGLIDDRWPPAARADVRSLVTSIAPVIGDLQSLSTVTLPSAPTWVTTFERDVDGVKTAVAHVRHDLGLPPAKD
jgi:hypothetical protein